ncbi:acetyl-CoA carboxylase biotin carboxyl carrier protein [Silvibacterium dinghuense]|uniref:Biotin carboxyl carrier protein of acetyl-CoA carboxylase n=2 Tax=Silvibacterium dinghuense TaxID=1560006 RepID=A0A4V1NVA1_9BACT|nr:acetyl-CoA carboxylase biotin carboxyl carrier protein [Silvibacterium dinghuense]RXS95050.1 acetyl-CoA carboxylase biotin carboxyl carrier protein [Silvibacterium dinghuense]GGH10161.1 acetyl-CoA carboxylase biotin carboxyl carrier protein subunit [Silvibacterium dinghuense]
MNPEEMKELQELIAFLKENKIAEFDLERGELKVRLKFQQEGGVSPDLATLARLFAAQGTAAAAPVVLPQVHAATAVAPAPVAAPPAAAEPAEDASLHIVKSPIVGTFYESPSPGSAAFVKVGDTVSNGQTLCIVEAMKLMNEIESDSAGEIVKRFVDNGQPVEYGQALYALRTR